MNFNNLIIERKLKPRKNNDNEKNKGDGWIYHPVGFDPTDYPGAIADHPDAARWLLNTIYFRKIIRNYDASEFINLHSKLLAMVMGDVNHVRPIREALEKQGLIETDHEWILNKKSLGYRIGPKLSGAKWNRYYAEDKRFLKRVQKFKDWATNTNGYSHPVHYHLHGWVERVRLPDDGALEPVYLSIRSKEQGEPKEKTKEDLARHQAEQIRRGIFYRSVCPYGRYHSNVSGLCRELRQHLTINDKSLVEIDIVNSQPYFLAALLSEIAITSKNCPDLRKALFSNSFSKFFDKHKRQETGGEREGERNTPYVSGLSVSEKTFKEGNKKGEEREGEKHTSYVCGLRLLENISKDLRQFAEAVTAGGFYETFVEGQYRDEVKPKVFEILYGNVGVMENTSLTTTFKTIYPTVFDLLKKLKREKGYRWVGGELQRRESEIVIRGVCDRLRTDHPDVPVLTIHDSILTTPDHLSLVRNIMADEFSWLPFSPRFRVKGKGLEGQEGPSEAV